MVFGLSQSRHREIDAKELETMLNDGTALVVDVREPDEYAAGHIPGAVNVPLSSFQPSQLPQGEGKMLILNCVGGKRSGMALDKCGTAQEAVDTHLAGGIGAWKEAGLPVEK